MSELSTEIMPTDADPSGTPLDTVVADAFNALSSTRVLVGSSGVPINLVQLADGSNAEGVYDVLAPFVAQNAKIVGAAIVAAVQALAAQNAPTACFHEDLGAGATTALQAPTQGTRVVRAVVSNSDPATQTVLVFHSSSGSASAYDPAADVLLHAYALAPGTNVSSPCLTAVPAGRYLRVQASGGGLSIALETA